MGKIGAEKGDSIEELEKKMQDLEKIVQITKGKDTVENILSPTFRFPLFKNNWISSAPYVQNYVRIFHI